MLQNDLYNWLANHASIPGLFPGGIHHNSIPQDVSVWPAMAFFQVSHIEIAEDMDGPAGDLLDQTQYQFDVVADNSNDAVTAANQFLSIFRVFRGTMTATRIQSIALANVSHLEERRGDKLRRRVSMDFSITFDVTE